ncbi:zinc-ribbon domain-containing protein [Lactobacillus delbrueckii]|uniref:zinc ribbon domain-containing protein n=1 Tax=Lactobacillus delbrueckii TaxID=1584 RepID=UPI0009BA2E20|nr:zinc-ribbon domain-containing protein [Lactobacillus delbrueckii]MCT3494104.1 zinc-ribbon domain-containing protein [Lactobacillus delbrueckii]MCT3521840.1 zinc-ribbon domain-containing protein [Lactobacillus delbrueckii]
MCCIHCGAKLPEGTNFCIKCGAPVEKVESDGSEKKPAVVNQVDNSIDQMGEQIGQIINDDRLIYDGTALGMLVRALVVILTLVIPFAFLASPWAYCWLWRYQYSHTHVDHSSAE